MKTYSRYLSAACNVYTIGRCLPVVCCWLLNVVDDVIHVWRSCVHCRRNTWMPWTSRRSQRKSWREPSPPPPPSKRNWPNWRKRLRVWMLCIKSRMNCWVSKGLFQWLGDWGIDWWLDWMIEWLTDQGNEQFGSAMCVCCDYLMPVPQKGYFTAR